MPIQIQDPLTVELAALAASDPEEARESARARYCVAWWHSDDPYIVVLAQLREPVLLVPSIEHLRVACELVLGRPVGMWELTDRERLLREFESLGHE